MMRYLFLLGLAVLTCAFVSFRGAIYRGTLAERASASVVPAALWVVTDCATATCAAGGATMECLTQRTSAAWDVVVCGTTTTSSSSSTSTSTTTNTTTTT